MKASYTKSCKIKNLLETLPVMAKLQALRPHVYDNSWSHCIKCKQQHESFQHIWIYPVTLDTLHQIIQSKLDFLNSTWGTVCSAIRYSVKVNC